VDPTGVNEAMPAAIRLVLQQCRADRVKCKKTRKCAHWASGNATLASLHAAGPTTAASTTRPAASKHLVGDPAGGCG
jgi:hypothetical protein